MNTEQFDGHTLNDSLKMDEPDYDNAREMLCGGGIVGWLTMGDYPSAEANARLIAAAPDLLAEVKRLREAFLIATGHIGWGNHLGHTELRHALNSAGIDADSLSWADGEWSEEQ
jgi:hypothetical protein